jgi:hypothetical protein
MKKPASSMTMLDTSSKFVMDQSLSLSIILSFKLQIFADIQFATIVLAEGFQLFLLNERVEIREVNIPKKICREINYEWTIKTKALICLKMFSPLDISLSMPIVCFAVVFSLGKALAQSQRLFLFFCFSSP